MEQNAKVPNNYHLRKTEPFKNQQKKTVSTQMTFYRRHEKVSTISSIPKKNILNYIKMQDQKINQEHLNHNIVSAVSRVNIRQQYTRPNIFQRAHSQTKNKKLSVTQKGKSLKYWKNEGQKPAKIVKTIKNFFKEILSERDGCQCGENCETREFLLKWVGIPDELIKTNYNRLISKLMRHNKSGEKHIETEFSECDQCQSEHLLKERQKLFNQIKKDITRTQSTHPTFQNPSTLKKSERILACYVIEDPELGYVQGMNMIMSGILYHIKDEAKTYAVTRQLFHQIRDIYLKGFQKCYYHLNKCVSLIQLNIHDLYTHLNDLGVQIDVVVFPWILSLLSSIVPLDYLHLIYIGFIQFDGWVFIYRMVVSLLVYHKERLKQMNDSSDILVFLSATNEQERKMTDWADIYQYCLQLRI